jgi:oxygen-dependent protoporphyrinogen oxidase
LADVVVIGGGISGMTAAHRLLSTGADVVLLERREGLGGIVETIIDDGFLIEGGPDSFVTAKGSVLELASELGVEGEVIPANPENQGSYVWWDGRLHPLPGGLMLMVPSRIGPFLRSGLLSWRGKARALGDLVIPRSGGSDDESLGSFVRRRLGVEVLDRIAEPLVAGIHAAEPETMSLRASFPRFLDMESEHRSLIMAARGHRPSPGEGRSHFSSFRLGMGQLVESLSSAIDQVVVRTGADATGLETVGGGYLVSLSDGTRITTRGLVLAVPAPAASRLLEPLSPEASVHISGIDQVANQSVTLAFESERLPPLFGSGFVVPSGRGPRIRGVSYLSRKWTGRVPDDAFALLRVFTASVSADGDAIEMARADLSATIGVEAKPVRSWVRTHRQGLHRYTLGHLGRVERAERALATMPGIALAGAGFYGVGLNECIASGREAADLVVEDLGSQTSGNGWMQLGAGKQESAQVRGQRSSRGQGP